jgi:hypothetical protein
MKRKICGKLEENGKSFSIDLSRTRGGRGGCREESTVYIEGKEKVGRGEEDESVNVYRVFVRVYRMCQEGTAIFRENIPSVK